MKTLSQFDAIRSVRKPIVRPGSAFKDRRKEASRKACRKPKIQL